MNFENFNIRFKTSLITYPVSLSREEQEYVNFGDFCDLDEIIEILGNKKEKTFIGGGATVYVLNLYLR